MKQYIIIVLINSKIDREQRLAWGREQYKAKRNWESSADRQRRLANRREYDRQRYTALTLNNAIIHLKEEGAKTKSC